jgi:hypothetical protein
MILNPFEQLEFFVPDPRQAFNEVIESILRGQFGSRVLQSFGKEGRIPVLDPSSGSSKGVAVYQAKYFVRRWESYQRRQVREALQQTLREDHAVCRWTLCLPTCMAAEDVRWFNDWRKQQPIEVEVLDGNDLLARLKGPSGRIALEQMQSWGVTIPATETAQLWGRLRVSPAAPNSGLTYYLYASVYNGGGRPTKDLRVELAHSVTRCASLHHDERQWHTEGRAQLNPRMLRACRPLLPKENRLVAVIPISLQTPLPVTLRFRIWAQDSTMLEQHLSLDPRMLAHATQIDFITGAGPEFPPTPTAGGAAAAAAAAA